jgi:hypothetical protein
VCRYAAPKCRDVEELERKYWKNVTYIKPIYGADVSGSLFDKSQDVWNIGRLGSILDVVNDDYGVKVCKLIFHSFGIYMMGQKFHHNPQPLFWAKSYRICIETSYFFAMPWEQ